MTDKCNGFERESTCCSADRTWTKSKPVMTRSQRVY